jgi:hypothetical protein
VRTGVERQKSLGHLSSISTQVALFSSTDFTLAMLLTAGPSSWPSLKPRVIETWCRHFNCLLKSQLYRFVDRLLVPNSPETLSIKKLLTSSGYLNPSIWAISPLFTAGSSSYIFLVAVIVALVCSGWLFT